MTIEAELPDGRILEFPDGTKPEVIKAAAQRLMASPKQNSQPVPFKPGGETINDFIGQEVRSRSIPAQMLGGFGTALDNAAMRLKQAVSGLTPEDEARVRANREIAGTAPGMIGAIGGSVAMTGAPAVGLQGALTSLGSRVLPSAIAPTVAAGVTGGAISAGTNPVLRGESELSNVAMGAAGGVVGDVAARGLARVAQPITQSPAVRRMLSQDVVPTPGQAAGPQSALNNIEQRIANADPTGVLGSGRRRAVVEANAALLRKANPTNEPVSAGYEGIREVKGRVDAAYDAIYARLRKPISYDQQFDDAIREIPERIGISLTDAQKKEFDSVMRGAITDVLEKKGATGPTLRDMHNAISEAQSPYRYIPGQPRAPSDLKMAKAFDAAKEEFREMISRQADPSFKPAMEELGKKYSIVKSMLDKAEGSSAVRDGVLSPAQLFQASKRGGQEMRSFARDVNDVLGPTAPNSGTVQNAMIPYLLSGGAAGANEYLGGPGWLTAGLAAPMLLTRPGARYMLGDLIPGQAAVANALRSTAPYASVLGMGIGSQQK